jgi:DNA-binding NarL/FixJ family response regulator
VVGEAATGKDALQKAETLKPDLILMDLSMPEINGLQAIQVLARDFPQIKVLVLTAHEDTSYFLQLCQANAAGYVAKRVAGAELLRAIRNVVAGQAYFDETLAGRALADLGRKAVASAAAREVAPAHLSPREEEVLRAVAWGYTNKELADRLGLSVKTVETHKVRICDKLGLRSRAEMVQYAVRQGWLNETRSLPQLTP